MGSLVYIGEVFGSLLAMPIYSKIPVKYVLLISIVLQTVVILAFVFSGTNYGVMATCRFFTGVFQVFISIFGPIWCDAHGPSDKKTTWITYFIVATPVGMVAGYLITALILSFEGNWAWSFYLQVLLLVPIAFYIATINPDLLVLTAAADT